MQCFNNIFSSIQQKELKLDHVVEENNQLKKMKLVECLHKWPFELNNHMVLILKKKQQKTKKKQVRERKFMLFLLLLIFIY